MQIKVAENAEYSPNHNQRHCIQYNGLVFEERSPLVGLVIEKIIIVSRLHLTLSLSFVCH